MREVAVVLNSDLEPVYWHDPGDSTSVALPDSRALWDAIWENRETVCGVAHTHPGRGVPGPSGTDLTTFAAVEAALGGRLSWWVVSEDDVVEVLWTVNYMGEGRYRTMVVPRDGLYDEQWLSELRRRSYQGG